MTQKKIDPIEVYANTTRRARQVITQVKLGQAEDPTPCTDWNVTALIDHMAKAQMFYAGAVSGRELTARATPLETFDAAVTTFLTAIKAPGALDKMVQTRGGEIAGSEAVGRACLDITIHTWDLAKATKQDTRLDPTAVEFLLPRAEGVAKRPPSPAYKAAVEAPAGASSQDRLIALTGRKP